ncbi:DUF55-domain-containing protein [Laetiporus sulphureus 93-53]|uniref:DUF55-domain-containing protein n=1 Tax=Laetiporus sulphureus 93-53 TaxID=1314785 RepID=A0A165E9B9_9APHY|nr:DUF55-domain-containing protein [Laetiporus sulphureus 93-53]KZT06518.1 DUF55-domain-containing protein [Laetiporus sulphureus 93-53]
MSAKFWLMKAEPDSRIVKGKDVKFSVDDFESVKTTPWEGVRNAEARNLMKEMKAGDRVLFYHSNCKNPGIAAFAMVTKEAYPDYTAWDPTHPYYDAKTDKADPKWYMVDVTFVSRAAHFVPLSLLRNIAAAPPDAPPSGVEYIGSDGVKAIKEMVLVTRGRLSVQRVEEKTWGVLEDLAEKGGWEEAGVSAPKAKGKKKSASNGAASKKRKGPGKATKDETKDDEPSVTAEGGPPATQDVSDEVATTKKKVTSRSHKRKVDDGDTKPDEALVRRSTRLRKN